MKTLKFTSDDPRQKAFGIAVRKNVNTYFKEKGLSTKGNAAMAVKAVILLLVYLGPFVILLTVPVSLQAALLLVIVMGIGEAGVGMSVMHDAAHGAFSKRQWVNSMLSSTMYLLGSNTFNWKVQHNMQHHSFTNVYGYDPDIETKAVIRLNEHAGLKKIHRFQYLYAYFLYGLMTISKLFSDFFQLSRFSREGITKEQGRKPAVEMFKLIVSKLAYFTVIIGLPLWLTGFTWWQVLVGFSILHLTAGMIMSTVFQMAHVVEGTEQPLPDGNGVISTEWAVHELRTTADFARNNHILNWYVGGLNFQIEHHLFPNICHIHYPKIAPIVQRTAEEFGVRYNLKPSLSAVFLSHARRLWELGRIAGPVRPLSH